MNKKNREHLIENMKNSMLVTLKSAYSLDDKEIEELLFNLVSLQLKASLQGKRNKKSGNY